MWISLEALLFMSAVGSFLVHTTIPKLRQMFIKAGIFGIDLNKRRPEPPDEPEKIPEATGVITGCVFLMVTILLIPMTFSRYLVSGNSSIDKSEFPHSEFVMVLSALLSISCMLLLGFADDVLDLRWRHKLLLPTMASLPLLMVYYVTYDRTDIVVPVILRPLLGTNVDLSLLYYVYMGMLAVFCTNAINILAGINGLEVGQSVVIALSVVAFNLGEMDGPLGHYHRFSLYFLLPYLGTTLPLLHHNWYPSSVFAGDTFCYFSGMTLAVVAILGHFSKTLLLFFIPQVLNFLYSVPQLFHLIPCPRHRLPKYDPATDKVGMSMSVFKESDLRWPGGFLLCAASSLRLVHLRRFERDGERWMECNNLTIINLCLKMIGPMHERSLTIALLSLQVACSILAFVIRYPLALFFYGEIVA